jgi:5'-3' exonuclease
MRLIVDANSWLNQALLRGTDHDNGRVVLDAEGKKVQVNNADYGVDGFFEKLTAALEKFGSAPREVLLVWDGANAKLRRRTFLPTYKAGRDKIPEVSEQLNLARDTVNRMSYALGMPVIQQPGLEADDVIAYLCAHLRNDRNTVVTGDGDLSRLVDENTDVWANGELNKNPFGPFPHKYITLYKALVGDVGDKIPGAKGFGDAKFVQLVAAFGLEGLDAFIELIQNDQLQRLKEDVADFPPLQIVLNDMHGVYTSWRVASFLTHEVNTLHNPLRIVPGLVQQWSTLDPNLRVDSLKHFYGTKTLVTAANYESVKRRFAQAVKTSPFTALDIETSESDQSEEWVEQVRVAMESESGKGKGKAKFDSLGHELTGMGLTFGENSQHTLYMTVDHADSDNITVDQCREMCEQIPQSQQIIIQNRQFEFTVLYRTWGDMWKGNGWCGFVPNALDTVIGASYVDENLPGGLKERSKLHLNYEQQTYLETVTKSGPVGSLRGGKLRKTFKQEVVPAVKDFVFNPEIGGNEEVVITPAVVEEWESREYRMNEMTAAEVFDYGCDDTICTAALHTYYTLVMEMEGTLEAYHAVETLPEYQTSLAFVQGVPISLRKLQEMSAKDDARYEAGWVVLRDYLMENGWEGTVCPKFTELNPAIVKEAASILFDTDEVQFTSKKRKPSALAADIRDQFPDSQLALLAAEYVEAEDAVGLQGLVLQHFTGEPKINFGSPKQMQRLFYHVLGMRPRIINSMTQNQRENNPVMVEAFKKLRKAKDLDVDLFSVTEPLEGKNSKGRVVKLTPVTDEERLQLISKASTDDDAVRWALARDQLEDGQRKVLEAFSAIRTVQTRRSMFYKAYRAIPHWRDGRIHPNMKQCGTVTRRHASSNPNAQQLPKLGEGVEFREVIRPHCKDAVVVSLDFSAQELRIIAEWSGDTNLTACYVGDNLRDVHSLTASAAAIHLWGQEVGYDEFRGMLTSPDKVLAKKAKDLRTDAKPVNFGTNYDQQAPALAVQLLVDEEVAQAFIDAKDAAMPGINLWKDEVRKEAEKLGYVTTFLGARRHLRDALLADDRWEAAKAGRQGPNFKIQGSAGEQTKLSVAEMWRRRIFAGRYNAQFYFPVHDEVVFSVHKDDAFKVISEAHACMVQPYGGMKIPIISEISLGSSFGRQIEVGDVPDERRINEAIAEALAEA